MSPTAADHELARRVADAAGSLLIHLRGQLHRDGAEEAEIRAAGDRSSHELIIEMLSSEAPDDPVLSEEGRDDLARLSSERVWVVDPLDGTREFGEVPRDDWAVHVALCVGGRPLAGAVALPAQGVTLSTDDPAPLADASGGPVRLIVSRSRPPRVATALVDALGGELVEMGSAGAKAMAVVQGAADVYAHGGGQYEWDSAAPVAVAAAAGCHTSRLDGSALIYNNEDPYLPDLLICRPELAEQVLGALSALDIS